MTNEIAQYQEKWFILMKSGLIHWVSKDTGEKASEHLANQSGHSFIRIKELNNISINTAEMEGVYDHQTYENLCRVKSGEWQCSYGKWHMKKGECQCKAEYYKEQERKRKEKEDADANRPLTPEEQEKSRDSMTRMSEMSCLDSDRAGIFRQMFAKGNRSGRYLRRKTIEEWEKKNGRKADLEGLALEGDKDITNNKAQS